MNPMNAQRAIDAINSVSLEDSLLGWRTDSDTRQGIKDFDIKSLNDFLAEFTEAARTSEPNIELQYLTPARLDAMNKKGVTLRELFDSGALIMLTYDENSHESHIEGRLASAYKLHKIGDSVNVPGMEGTGGPTSVRRVIKIQGNDSPSDATLKEESEAAMTGGANLLIDMSLLRKLAGPKVGGPQPARI